jgi:ubiquinone biosynthesis protein Coq4
MKLRDKLISFNVHCLALPVLKKFMGPELVPLTMNELQQLPEGSLGNDLFHFLTRNHFTLLPYFETHDVKHVLLDYGTTGKDEACIQYFYIANGHYSIATVVSAIASFILMPDYFFAFLKAFNRGRKALPIGNLHLGELLHCNASELKARFQIERISSNNQYKPITRKNALHALPSCLSDYSDRNCPGGR